MIYGYRTSEKMLEWQSSRLAPFAPQFAVVVIMFRRWARQRRACRNPTSASSIEQRGGLVGSLHAKGGGDTKAIILIIGRILIKKNKLWGKK